MSEPSRAIVRMPSPRLAEGEVTHLERVPVDVPSALAQHAGYCALLRRLGLTLVEAPAAPEHPDGLFVEDAVVVVDDLAVLTRPGAPSRAGEVASIEPVVRALGLRVARIEPPDTLDGGDVLTTPTHVFVGRSTRTGDGAIAQLATLLAPQGRTVVAIEVEGFLHLKSAITALPDGSLIAVPGSVDEARFRSLGFEVHAAGDRSGGDVLCVGRTVVLPASARETAGIIARLGFAVEPVEVGELEKLEAGVTCMSVLC